MTFSYEDLCKKIGLDPLKDPDPTPYHGHEDDSHESVFAALSPEELDFMFYYLKERLQQN